MRAWFTDPSPAGIFLALTLMSIAAGIAIVALPARGADPDPAVERTDRALQWWARGAPRHPLRRAAYRGEVARALVDGAARHDLPVELVTAMALRESSARPGVLGRAGEAGLMQVHPDTAARFGCRLGTPQGDIECGCRVLSYHRVRCGGDLAGALSAYGSRSGTCTPPPGGSLARMVRDRLALAADLLSIMDGKTPPSP